MRKRFGGYGMQVTESLAVKGYSSGPDGAPGAAEIAGVPEGSTILSVGGYVEMQCDRPAPASVQQLRTTMHSVPVCTRTDLKSALQRLEALGADEVDFVFQLPLPPPGAAAVAAAGLGEPAAGGGWPSHVTSGEEGQQPRPSTPQLPATDGNLTNELALGGSGAAAAAAAAAASAAGGRSTAVVARPQPRTMRDQAGWSDQPVSKKVKRATGSGKPGRRSSQHQPAYLAPSPSALREQDSHGGYQCEHCSRLYAREDTLRRHRKTCISAGGGYQCKHCQRGFQYHGSLQRHLESCNGGEDADGSGSPGGGGGGQGVMAAGRFRCPDCHRTYARIDGLARHQKKCHGVPPVSQQASRSVPKPAPKRLSDSRSKVIGGGRTAGDHRHQKRKKKAAEKPRRRQRRQQQQEQDEEEIEDEENREEDQEEDYYGSALAGYRDPLVNHIGSGGGGDGPSSWDARWESLDSAEESLSSNIPVGLSADDPARRIALAVAAADGKPLSAVLAASRPQGASSLFVAKGSSSSSSGSGGSGGSGGGSGGSSGGSSGRSGKSDRSRSSDGTVQRFLAGIGLGEQAVLFDSHEVDFEALLLCGEAELQAIGLKLGPRLKVMQNRQRWADANGVGGAGGGGGGGGLQSAAAQSGGKPPGLAAARGRRQHRPEQVGGSSSASSDGSGSDSDLDSGSSSSGSSSGSGSSDGSGSESSGGSSSSGSDSDGEAGAADEDETDWL
eukprot:SAG22_NODE_35_length_27276_cov_20.395849_16_plen_726_part_00